MTQKETKEAPWAYQGASDVAERLSDEAADLFNEIQEEMAPDDLLEKVDKIETLADQLRSELDEMPRF